MFVRVNQCCILNSSARGSARFLKIFCCQVSSEFSNCKLHPARLRNPGVCASQRCPLTVPHVAFMVGLEVSVLPDFVVKIAVLTHTARQRALLTGVGNGCGWVNLVMSFSGIPGSAKTPCCICSPQLKVDFLAQQVQAKTSCNITSNRATTPALNTICAVSVFQLVLWGNNVICFGYYRRLLGHWLF